MDRTLGLLLTASQRTECPRTLVAVHCPHGHREQSVTCGTTPRGTQRSLCQHTAGATGRVLLDDRHRGCVPAVQHPLIAMRLHASGMRETARVLRSRTDTGLRVRRKQDAALASVNAALRRTLPRAAGIGAMERAGEAARDAVGSCIGKQHEPRWRWQALDHPTGAG
jgi:hypothetical protein